MLAPCSIIIPAGGIGSRFSRELPKQFTPVHGLPILAHTLRALASKAAEIVVALPEEWIDYWRQQVVALSTRVPSHRMVVGGATRFHSVQSALSTMGHSGFIAVHDAVRPLMSEELLDRLLVAAERQYAAVPVLPLSDSIRQLSSDGGSIALDRSLYRRVQTPQVFLAERLHAAYSVVYSSRFTDDLSVYEASFSEPIALVDGEEINLKVTFPHDLVLLKAFLPSLC